MSPYMSLIADETPIMTKTRELCDTIANSAEFLALQGKVETFLGDDAARLQYQSVHEQGQQLQQKQQSGIEIAEGEIGTFEEARESLFKNEVANDFLEAQRELEVLQMAIGKYVGLTIELGHVPSEEDFAAASQSGGGCCGGSGEESCGC